MISTVTTYASFLALFAALVLTGYVVSIDGIYLRHMVDANLPGKPLPALSILVLQIDGSRWPIFWGWVLGLGFLAALLVLETFPLERKWLPFVLSLGWGLCVLNLLSFTVGENLILPPSHIQRH